MKYILNLFVFCMPGQLLLAQKDTTLVYLNMDYKKTTKDSAYSFFKFYKQDNNWHGQEFYVKDNIIKSDVNYTDSTLTKRTDMTKYYKDDGTLDFTGTFRNDTLLDRTYYYKTGQKKSYILYKPKGASEAKGWDVDGKEIKGFIVEQEARFPGGAQGWQNYLIKNLNANVPVDAGMSAGTYMVMVSFLAAKDGAISEVKAMNDGNHCKVCVKEAVRVIASGPAWEPAIQNNEPVIYRQKQQITFMVEESGRKRKKKDD